MASPFWPRLSDAKPQEVEHTQQQQHTKKKKKQQQQQQQRLNMSERQQRPLLDPSPTPRPPSPFSFALPPHLPPPTPSFPAQPPHRHSPPPHPPRSRSVHSLLPNPNPAPEPRMLHSKSADDSLSIPRSSLELSRLPPSKSVPHSGTLDAGDARAVFLNDPAQTRERSDVAGNRVRTSKYTPLSFLPRNLFEQFHRVAYIYFLVIAILNQLPQLAVFGRTASLFPLVFVLVITAIKDAYEDWRRHRSDSKENKRLALVLQGEYRPKSWEHIQVGELVKVHANETIPCDLVLLATSDESGLAYVQTINLDGESNLKTRYARPETAANHPELGPISGTVVCEKPNRNIYGFSAYLEFNDKKLPLGPTNVILRGCELKNTSWAVGVAVYAGQETKAMLNSSGAQSKRSLLEQKMNGEILWLSVFLFIMCLIGAVGMGLWLRRHKEQLNTLPYYGKKYLSTGEDYHYYGNFGEPFFGFLSFVIIFQIMIPISLYISMELVRLGQSFFMIRDSNMYHATSDSRFQCRALNINEDLGQIKYIFSDKTGTLTENKMEFRNASIHGVNYDNAKVITSVVGDTDTSLKHEDSHIITEVLGKETWQPKVGVKVDLQLIEILQGTYSWERKIAHDYLLALAACNTVVPTKVKVTDTGMLEMEAACASDEAGLIEYQGESPDEQALVYAAASYGYTLLERNSNEIVISVLGEIQRFQLLGLHEFDNIRKCMSVVVQCPDNTIKLLVKGADSSILSKLAKILEGTETANSDSRQAQLISATQKHLDLYAREGLRTLLVATKELSSMEFNGWKDHYARASTALVDRGGAIRETAKLVEKNLLLLGATGVEDKLQDGVPETIASLREAGIKIWVLTGDKQETAISIGFSCSLLTNDMQQIIVNGSEKEACRQTLYNAKSTYGLKTWKRSSSLTRKISVDVKTGENLPDASTSSWLFSSSAVRSTSTSVSSETGPLRRTISKEKKDRPLALIIDGNSLVHALDSDLEQEFYDLAAACKVVICCRVAPLQKAGIVSLVKRKSSDMTLAIGDGANDVSMIQTADVGVGISGQEGRQAVMASDFAMGQFRFLKRLLLVHGHWNYIRICYMVLYNFYRNAVFIFLLFWYIFYTAFSPVSAVTDWSAVFYSLIYTSVPTIVVGILDKDVSSKTLLKYPCLYRVGQLKECYNGTLFWLTMLDTVWQSLVVFYVPVFTYRQSTIDIWGLGSVWTLAIVIVVNLHLAMDTRRWTWITHAAIWGSIVATFICLIILDIIHSADFLPHYWVIFHMLGMANYWLDILLIICLALLPRFLVNSVRDHFWPNDIQIARETEILNDRSRKGSRLQQTEETT